MQIVSAFIALCLAAVTLARTVYVKPLPSVHFSPQSPLHTPNKEQQQHRYINDLTYVAVRTA